MPLTKQMAHICHHGIVYLAAGGIVFMESQQRRVQHTFGDGQQFHDKLLRKFPFFRVSPFIHSPMLPGIFHVGISSKFWLL